MKRQNGISKMKSINMGEQYFKGVLPGDRSLTSGYLTPETLRTLSKT
jgi:hypothetical protein